MIPIEECLKTDSNVEVIEAGWLKGEYKIRKIFFHFVIFSRFSSVPERLKKTCARAAMPALEKVKKEHKGGNRHCDRAK